MKRLYRPKKDQVIAGVCAGLGRYFEVDPIFVRILFILFTLAGGGGVLLYILLWVVIPSEDAVSQEFGSTVKENSAEIKEKVMNVAAKWEDGRHRHMWGWLVVFLGVFLLLSNLGAFQWFRLDLVWPILIVTLGLILIVKR
ncbi:MAG: PspC domain-containing protein [Candidatus Doudnabacteria bacterium]|nr:PspC domain-containing protein [Candidatus Doudnabacteria bacterium]